MSLHHIISHSEVVPIFGINYCFEKYIITSKIVLLLTIIFIYVPLNNWTFDTSTKTETKSLTTNRTKDIIL